MIYDVYIIDLIRPNFCLHFLHWWIIIFLVVLLPSPAHSHDSASEQGSPRLVETSAFARSYETAKNLKINRLLRNLINDVIIKSINDR